MKMLKYLRTPALILALLMLVCCCFACNGADSDATDGTDEPTNAPTEAPTEKPTETDAPDTREPNIVFSEDFGKYSVIVDDSADSELKTLAKNLTDTLNSCWKVTATLVTDKNTEASAYEILVGNTDRPETATFREKLKDGECGFGVVGRKIVILGSEDAYTEKAVVLFANFMLLDKDTSVKKYMSEKNTHIVDATNMISVMSYNVQVGNSDNNPSTVSAMIRNYMPDLLGVQEADGEWMSVLNNRLSKNGYAYVGIGRDSDGKGERSAIFYRADKFELIESKTLWLSATPDVVSRVEGALCNRIVTMATFKRLSDGKVFTHANTHLDHSNSDVRSQQVTYLDRYIKEFTDGEFIVTGDFNFQPDNRVYAQMMSLGYENCAQLADYARGREDNTFTGGSMIDFCFRYGNTEFDPYFYAVCDELISGKTPSDHHAIFFILELK
ncbi:MAG: endonuclease/exonuclease/phosphatase family protein [Clostridia bacterium]|nr:endonuclease/exonuclease/phosphatase family protein [Clostridia bacterium]